MDYNRIASDILEHVGGKENVKNVTHCFTRLRFVLKDESKAQKEIVEHLEGVISVVVAGGQFQVCLLYTSICIIFRHHFSAVRLGI